MNKNTLIFIAWSAIAFAFMAGVYWYDHTFNDPGRDIRKVVVTDTFGNKNTYYLTVHKK